MPYASSKVDFWTKIMGTYTYYLNSKGEPVYLTKFEKVISEVTIEQYKCLFKELDCNKLLNCIRALEAESKRFDTFVPQSNAIGVGFVSLIPSIGIKYIDASDFGKFVLVAFDVMFALGMTLRALKNDSIKRAHIDVMLSILRQKEKGEILFDKPSNKLLLLIDMGELREKGYLSEEEFQREKDKILNTHVQI